MSTKKGEKETHPDEQAYSPTIPQVENPSKSNHSSPKICHDTNTTGIITEAQNVGDDIASSTRGELAILLGGAEKADLPLLEKHGVEFYRKPDTTTVSFPLKEITSRWVYQLEDDSLEAAPQGVSAWMCSWLFEKDLIPSTFAPVSDWEKKVLSAKSNTRDSKKRKDIRDLCEGEFRFDGDFMKSFVCSWKKAERHKCPATLSVVLCARKAFSIGAKNPPGTSARVDVQCVWSAGCEHHKYDKDRGVVRSSLRTRLIEKAITPRGVCHNSIQGSKTMAVAAGNRSFGYIKTSTARHAQYAERRKAFKKHDNPIANIAILAKHFAHIDLKQDPFRHWKFHGSIHDILIMSSGDISSVSIYTPLSIDIISKELKANQNAAIVIDCTGNLVGDTWVSASSEMARRSLSGKGKDAKKKSPDETMLLYDTLVFHLAISLPSGPFVAAEAVVVERTGRVFENILRGFNHRLGLCGSHVSVPFVVTDMSIPFAYAVNQVFNRMDIPSYMAALIWSAKKMQPGLRKQHVNCILIWCGVHGDRAVRNFCKKHISRETTDAQAEMETLFRNIRLALVAAKGYEDLCALVGFLDRLLAFETFEVVTHRQQRRVIKVASQDIIRSEGEALIWQDLGGVPSDDSDISAVKLRACSGKGYSLHANQEFNGTVIDGATKQVGDVIREDGYQLQPATEVVTTSEEKSVGIEEIQGSSEGVLVYEFGDFCVYIVSRDPSKSRYRVYIPSLSMLTGSLGGFQCFLELHGKEIRNMAFCGGLSRNYWRNQWFSNLALICPVLMGRIPEDHNTTVELSFKIKKHHSDLGVQARRRSGHMPFAEYVQRASEELKLESKRTIALLSGMYRPGNRLSNSKKKEGQNVDANKSKKKTFSAIITETDPVQINKRLKPGVFIRKEGSELAPPPSQQSQQDVAQSEETWSRKKQDGPAEEAAKIRFKKILQDARHRFFGSWSQSRMALFLTQNALSSKGLKIDKSHISRSLKAGPFPGKVIRVEIESFCSDVLPKLTADIDHAKNEFSLLPGAIETLEKVKEELKIEYYLRNASHNFDDSNVIVATFGDAQVKREDMRRLMRPINWDSQGSCENNPSQELFWISDEVVNLTSSMLAAILQDSNKLFFFNSLTVLSLYECYYGEGSMKDIDYDKRKERAIRILKRLLEQGRTGQKFKLDDADRFFVPCQVGQVGRRNHWTALIISKTTNEIASFDSMKTRDENGNSATYKHAKLLEQVMKWLSELNGTEFGNSSDPDYRYLGDDDSFPQQTNSMDCGIFMMLAARKAAIGYRFSSSQFHQGNIGRWRFRLAHEILVNHVQ